MSPVPLRQSAAEAAPLEVKMNEAYLIVMHAGTDFHESLKYNLRIRFESTTGPSVRNLPLIELKAASYFQDQYIYMPPAIKGMSRDGIAKSNN